MRAQTRDLPPRVIRFPRLHAVGAPDLCPTSARVADQTVERDWHQAMPRAKPAQSLALRPLSAVLTPHWEEPVPTMAVVVKEPLDPSL